jgi:hypothetical protein
MYKGEYSEFVDDIDGIKEKYPQYSIFKHK